MLLHLRTFAAPSRLLGGHSPRILSMRTLSSPTNVVNASLRVFFRRRCLTTQLLTKSASRRSVITGRGVGVTVVVLGGTAMARFLMRHDLHRTECQAKSFSRPILQTESSNDSEPVFNWRRFLALILPVKWLLSAAVAVSASTAVSLASQYSSTHYVIGII